MTSIYLKIDEQLEKKQRTLTPEEIDSIIFEVTNWDASIDTEAEWFGEAFEMIIDREAHIYREQQE